MLRQVGPECTSGESEGKENPAQVGTGGTRSAGVMAS